MGLVITPTDEFREPDLYEEFREDVVLTMRSDAGLIAFHPDLFCGWAGYSYDLGFPSPGGWLRAGMRFTDRWDSGNRLSWFLWLKDAKPEEYAAAAKKLLAMGRYSEKLSEIGDGG